MWSIKRLFGKRKKIEHYDIVESFQNSFESDNAIDFVVESADLAFEKIVKMPEGQVSGISLSNSFEEER